MQKQLRVGAAILAVAAVGAGSALAHGKPSPRGITVAQAEAAVSAAIGHQGGAASVRCVGLGLPREHTFKSFICHATGSYIDAYFRVHVEDHGKIEIKPIRK